MSENFLFNENTEQFIFILQHAPGQGNGTANT